MSRLDDIREQLSAYLDGELGEADTRRVESALVDSEGLRDQLDRLRKTRELIQAAPRASAPEGFTHRVMSRAERKRLMGDQPGRGRYRSFRWITLASAAVVLLAAGLGMFLLVYNQPPPSTDSLAGSHDGKVHAVPADDTVQNPAGGNGRGRERSEGLELLARRGGSPAIHGQGGGSGGGLESPVVSKGGPANFDHTPTKAIARLGTSGPAKDAYSGVTHLLASVDNVEINTTDLGSTRRELVHLLVSNGLKPLPVHQPRAQDAREQYVVFFDNDSQYRNVQRGLSKLAARQRVSQEPVNLQLRDMAVANRMLNSDSPVVRGRRAKAGRSADVELRKADVPRVSAAPAPAAKPASDPLAAGSPFSPEKKRNTEGAAAPTAVAPKPATPPAKAPATVVLPSTPEGGVGKGLHGRSRLGPPEPSPRATRQPAKPRPEPVPPVPTDGTGNQTDRPARKTKPIVSAVKPAEPAGPPAAEPAPATPRPTTPTVPGSVVAGRKDVGQADRKLKTTAGDVGGKVLGEPKAAPAKLRRPGAAQSPATLPEPGGGAGFNTRYARAKKTPGQTHEVEKIRDEAKEAQAETAPAAGQAGQAVASGEHAKYEEEAGQVLGVEDRSQQDGRWGWLRRQVAVVQEAANGRRAEVQQAKQAQMERRGRAVIVTLNGLPHDIDAVQAELNRALRTNTARQAPPAATTPPATGKTGETIRK